MFITLTEKEVRLLQQWFPDARVKPAAGDEESEHAARYKIRGISGRELEKFLAEIKVKSPEKKANSREENNLSQPQKTSLPRADGTPEDVIFDENEKKPKKNEEDGDMADNDFLSHITKGFESLRSSLEARIQAAAQETVGSLEKMEAEARERIDKAVQGTEEMKARAESELQNVRGLLDKTFAEQNKAIAAAKEDIKKLVSDTEKDLTSKIQEVVSRTEKVENTLKRAGEVLHGKNE